MTAKRFEYKNHKVYDNLTGETHSSNMVSVNVLNELHEENQTLKKQLTSEHQMLENAILLERTRMGKNCLKQFREAIQ